MQFPLTKCVVWATPTPRGQGRTSVPKHIHEGDSHLSITPTANLATISIVKGSQTLVTHRVKKLRSETAGPEPRPLCIWRDLQVSLRNPVGRGLDEACQVKFADRDTARLAVTQLRQFYDVSEQGVQSQPSQRMPAGPPPYPSDTTASQAMPSALANVSASRVQPATSQPIDEPPETQDYMETQKSVNVPDNIPKHPHKQTESSDSSVPSTEESASDLPATKKRKVHADEVERPVTSTSLSNREQTAVANLIDFDDADEQFSHSLRNDHPALNPYEGKPWARLDQLSRQHQSTEQGELVMVERPNRYITAGVYGMSDAELQSTLDEIVTEVGFQQMCERVANLMDARRHEHNVYGNVVDSGHYINHIHEDERW